jgi:hypothetical protein
MARARLTFRERDVIAAIRAVEKAGHKPYRVLIGPDGSITLELTPPATNETAPNLEPNPWDQEFERGNPQ